MLLFKTEDKVSVNILMLLYSGRLEFFIFYEFKPELYYLYFTRQHYTQSNNRKNVSFLSLHFKMF